MIRRNATRSFVELGVKLITPATKRFIYFISCIKCIFLYAKKSRYETAEDSNFNAGVTEEPAKFMS